MKSMAWRLLLAATTLTLCGCATVIAEMVPETRFKIGDDVACDQHQSIISPVSEELCENVNNLLQKEAGLPDVKVGFDVQGKGTLQLAGTFKDEDEVERAFAMAQAVVGSMWVSPVTPAHIKVADWQQCLKAKIAGRQCNGWDKEPYSLDKKPPGPVRDKYALIVGVSHFKNNAKWKLNFPVKDAKAIASYLTDHGGFKDTHVTVLTDEQATSQAILSALDDLERRAKPDDLVIVYFSSHGASPDQFGRVNIVTYDTDLLFGKQKLEALTEREKLLQRQSVWDTSIPGQRVNDFFRKVQSKRVLMILDVCYSGDVFSQIPGFRPTGSEALAQNEEKSVASFSAEQFIKDFGAKDLMVEDNKGGLVEPLPSPLSRPGKKTTKKIKKLSDTLAKSWGKVVISASSGKEQSWEPDPRIDPVTSNSYFTYYFLDGLQQTKGLIQDSFISAVPEVAETAKQKGKTQQPQSFSIPDRDHWNFSINSPR